MTSKINAGNAAPHVHVNKSANASALLADVYASCDAGGDFTLPDYLPPIRKIVSVTGKPSPQGKFVSGTDAGDGYVVRSGGDVRWNVVYLSENGELSGAQLTSDYECSAGIGRTNGTITTDTSVESTTCRVTAPRRLSLKSRLRCRVTATGERDYGATVLNCATAADEIALERLEKKAPASSIISGTGESYRSDGEFTVDGRGAVICPDAKIIVTDVKADRDYAVVSGKLEISGVFAKPDGGDAMNENGTAEENGVLSETLVVPFTEEVAMDGDVTGTELCAYGGVTAFNVTSGEGDRPRYELTYNLEVTAVRRGELTLTEDMYSTASEMSCKYGDAEILTPAVCVNAAVTVNETVARDAAGAGMVELCDVTADASIDKIELRDRRLLATGTVCFRVTGFNKGEVNSAATEDFTVPLRYSVPVNAPDASPDAVFWRCSAVCSQPTCRMGSETRLKTEVAIALTALVKAKHRRLESAELNRSKPRAKSDNVIRLYYPDASETLWDAAKRYGKPWKTVAETNKIEENPRAKLKEGAVVI